MYNLYHQLAGLHSRKHILPQSFFFYSISKAFGDLIVHVSIQQSFTHILQRFRYINLGDFSLTFQNLKRPFQSLT